MLKSLSGKKCLNGLNAKVCAVLGAQWGDEGKGKLIDVLSEKYDIVARFNGGANAGHTIKVGDDKFFFHTIPSGMLRQNSINIIGNGTVLDPFVFMNELRQVEEKKVSWKNRLLISDKVHVTLRGHYEIERILEERGVTRIAHRDNQKGHWDHLRPQGASGQPPVRGLHGHRRTQSQIRRVL
jgi:adenylosuccinate synthase